MVTPWRSSVGMRASRFELVEGKLSTADGGACGIPWILITSPSAREPGMECTSPRPPELVFSGATATPVMNGERLQCGLANAGHRHWWRVGWCSNRVLQGYKPNLKAGFGQVSAAAL